MHSGGFELTKLTYTRLEDNLIRHRGDRLIRAPDPCYPTKSHRIPHYLTQSHNISLSGRVVGIGSCEGGNTVEKYQCVRSMTSHIVLSIKYVKYALYNPCESAECPTISYNIFDRNLPESQNVPQYPTMAFRPDVPSVSGAEMRPIRYEHVSARDQ